LWTIILPVTFGSVIVFLIIGKLIAFDILFNYAYYTSPFGGVIFFTIENKLEEFMEITYGS